MSAQTVRVDGVTGGIVVTGTVHGDVINQIRDIYNQVASSTTSDNLKELLKALTESVSKMAEKLPEEKAKQVVNDLQSLTNEATSKKPRRQWWELSAKGVKEAAQAVGEVGKVVLQHLGQLIPVLEQLS
jgi:hypothetical protein